MKLGVVFLNALALVNRAASTAHSKAEVPHRAGKFRNQRTKLFFRFLIFEEKQDVQIGVGKQHLPAVTAKRQQGQPVLRRVMHLQHVAERLVDGTVGKLAKLAQRFLGRRSSFKLVTNPLAFRFHLRNEITHGLC
jgi:hypothetical protein